MEIVRELSKSEISCHVLTCNSAYPFHWHDKYELCRCVDECDFLVDGALIHAKSGDIIAINELSVHQFLPPNNKTKIRVLQFKTDLALGIDSTARAIAPHIKNEDIKAIDGLDETVEFLFSVTEKESPCQSSQENPYLQSIVSALFFLLAKHFPKSEGDRAQKKERREFYKIAEYINMHFASDITVQSISNALYLSRGKVANVFSKYAGVSLSDYIRSVRVKNVNKMINEGYSITESAFACGFQNTRTFNNVYKKIMGITPTEYEKKKSQ